MKHTALVLTAVFLWGDSPARAELVMERKSLGSPYEAAVVTKPEAEEGNLWDYLACAGGGAVCGFLLFCVWKVKRNWKTPLLALLLSASAVEPARACLNVENETLESYYLRTVADSGWFNQPIESALASAPATDPHLTPNPAAYATEPAPGIRENDDAVRMILRGDAAGALRRLQQIEADHPGLYATAANMGSCYELTGDDNNALKWISEGIKRNPDAHMIAEWLHIRILETKIALKSDPDWLRTHTITGMDPALDAIDTLQGKKSGMQVLNSIRSQCTVRALFIKPEDPIMSQLLLEAARLLVRHDPPAVKSALRLAREYGLPGVSAREVQAMADGQIMKALQSTGASAVEIWITRWKYWLLFFAFLSIGFGLPAARLIQENRTAPRG